MNYLPTSLFFSLLAVLILFPQPASCAGYPNGTILQVQGDPALYYVINGYATHIPSMKVFQCMRLGSNKKVMVTPDQLRNMPKTSFLIEGGDGKVYRVDGQQKRHVPNLQVFRRLGFNDAEVIHITAQMVNCIPNGPPLR